MSIAPIKYSVEVKPSPARAFALFTGSMGKWWPSGRTPGGKAHADVIVESRVGGRWFERDAEGTETQWGVVLAWEPPTRLLLGWQLNGNFAFDPNLLTEVELSFEAVPGGGTRVSLEHRDLERFGTDAEKMSKAVSGGWRARLDDFVAFTAAGQINDA